MAKKKRQEKRKADQNKRENLIAERKNRIFICPITGEEKPLTQKQLCIELSPKIKITSQCYSAIERGENDPSFNLAAELVNYFGKPHAYLFHKRREL